jgi:heme/copper-type cytochrome/quinol oxidase subunit 2
MRTANVLLTAAGLATVTAVAFAVSASAAPASPAKAGGSTTTPHVQKESLTITGATTNEGVSPSSGNLAIAPGVPVRVTVTNYTREYHTITIPGLHVSALIFPARGNAARKTTFTFTANEYGTFAWYCGFCTSGAHGHRHMMGGTVYAIINPSVLP